MSRKRSNALSTMNRITILAVILAAMMTMRTGYAKKPDHAGGGGGKGETLDGVIYFRHSATIKAMNPDGSNKTNLPLSFWGLPIEPSDAEHGNGRWFLFSSASIPLGAMRDDDTIVTLIGPGDDGDWEVERGGISAGCSTSWRPKPALTGPTASCRGIPFAAMKTGT